MKARLLWRIALFLCIAVLFTDCEKSTIPSDIKITDHQIEEADLVDTIDALDGDYEKILTDIHFE